LFALDPEQKIRSLMVTSSKPAEGKSTTVANLALAIGQAGRRVIVVDGDLRKPSLHRIFKVSNSIGLTNVLTGDIPLNDAIQNGMIDGVHVLSSGPRSSNPAELLGLPAMHDIVAQLAEQFDYVLIDSPSLQSVADAEVLSLIVDRLVVVVARGLVRRESVDAALKELAGVQRKPLGVVVSHAETSSNFHYDRPADGDLGAKTSPDPTSRPGKGSAPRLRIIAPTQSSAKGKSGNAGQFQSSQLSVEETTDVNSDEGHESSGPVILRRIG
jgi:capsular exopolysaccharide synthesis family protein